MSFLWCLHPITELVSLSSTARQVFGSLGAPRMCVACGTDVWGDAQGCGHVFGVPASGRDGVTRFRRGCRRLSYRGRGARRCVVVWARPLRASAVGRENGGDQSADSRGYVALKDCYRLWMTGFWKKGLHLGLVGERENCCSLMTH